MFCIHCREPAAFLSKGKKPLCKPHAQSCPAVKAVNAKRLAEAHERKRQAGVPYRILTEEARLSHGWSRGKTAKTDPSLARMVKLVTGRRYLTDEREYERRIYYDASSFNITDCIERVRGYELLKELGMYHIKHNCNGVVRDHRLSRAYGFKNDIPPMIIGHPANCEFIQHKRNASKSQKSSITYKQLLEDIEAWSLG